MRTYGGIKKCFNPNCLNTHFRRFYEYVKIVRCLTPFRISEIHIMSFEKKDSTGKMRFGLNIVKINNFICKLYFTCFKILNISLNVSLIFTRS